MISDILRSCTDLLKSNKLTLAFAESATAGQVMADFSLVPEAGTFLKGGVVCYDACIKQSLLKVNADLIKKYSPESAEVTKAAAEGLRKLIEADIHVGITGLTRPGGSETREKPVGTMFICVLYQEQAVTERRVFSGDEETINDQTVQFVAQAILELIRKNE